MRDVWASSVLPAEAVESLRSLVCPACGEPKKRMKTLCGSCYFRVPRHEQKALYSRSGEGYEQAIAAAFKSLDVEVFTMPPEKKPCPTKAPADPATRPSSGS